MPSCLSEENRKRRLQIACKAPLFPPQKHTNQSLLRRSNISVIIGRLIFF
jgi:hypothetical protein